MYFASQEGGSTVILGIGIAGMGLSYVLLLIAFYVDNGKQLPLWKDLPHFTYWLLPLAAGVPLIIRALLRHPLARGPATRRL